MSFRVGQKTLESLEWPDVRTLLHEQCRTPHASGNLQEFAEGLAEVKTRLAETSEARVLLDGDHVEPGPGSELALAQRTAGQRLRDGLDEEIHTFADEHELASMHQRSQ